MKSNWAVIGRGKVGWHAQARKVEYPNGSSSKSSSSGGTLESYLKEAIEGALVYDAIDANDAAFVKLVIRGPMVDPDLPSDAIKKFGKEEMQTLLGMLPALGGEMRGAATVASLGGLDYVGVGVYETMLREVPGVRIGRVTKGVVIWEKR